MRNLLSAGLVRLLRCRTLWFSCAVMAVLETVVMLDGYRDKTEFGVFVYLDGKYLFFPALVGILSALVCAFFIGPEYGDGTMRNKVIIGCSRRDVYLANLLLSGLSSLIICAAAIIPALAVGLPLLDGFRMGTLRAAVVTLGILALSLAYAAIFTLVVMLIDNRAVASVAALLLSLLFLLEGSYVYNRLDALPFLQSYQLSVDGELVDAEDVPNPNYLPDGPVREAYKRLNDCLPGGQTLQYADGSGGKPEVMIPCDAGIVLLSTGAGLALFKRKDLK